MQVYRFSMRMPAFFAVGMTAFLCTAVTYSQVVENPSSDSTCHSGYVLIIDVCVAQSAFDTYSGSELINLIQQHKGLYPLYKARVPFKLCQSKIAENADEYFELRDGSFLKKTGYGYIGYIGYAKDTVLIMESSSKGTLLIEGKSPFEVEVIRAPIRCSSPRTFPIELAVNDEHFVINGELFEAQTYCLRWEVGDSVVFLDGSEYGACATAELYNIDKGEACSVWCE